MSLRIGVIGGGQLGKLLIEKSLSSATVRIYSPELPLCHPDSYQEWVKGRLDDFEKLVEFGRLNDVVTYEIESVNVSALREIRDQCNAKVYPSPEILEKIQNKARQKEALSEMDVPIPRYVAYSKENQFIDTFPDFLKGKMIMNKTQEGGYDGYGVKKIDLKNIGLSSGMVFPVGILEEMINIEKELSVIVARDVRGGMMTFPVVEMVMGSDHKLLYSITPARISDSVMGECYGLAKMIAEKMDLVGIMAVEMFLSDDGDVLVNELAPRPHNSGHQTIEYCGKSQYDILAMILRGERIDFYSSVDNCAPSRGKVAVLENIIGNASFKNPRLSFEYVLSGASRLGVSREQIVIHDYQKEFCRVGRKLGHVVALVDEEKLEDWVKEIELCRSSGISRIRIERPQVGVIMGSQSDYDVVKPCLEILDSFGIHYDVRVVSAHRTPHSMIDYGSSAHENGFDVIICAAGGAAHLPGMIASCTLCPVIGIPIKSANSMDGWDSLLSIAQMPGGIPVATMALNGAKNAGLMAIRILAVSDHELYLKLENYQKGLEEKVAGQNYELRLISLRGNHT